ncbi:hypothetical protein VULLAG_LOCUS12350 [Vulpes lagopus]
MVGGPAGVLSASSRSEPEPLCGCQPEIRPRRVIKHRPGPGPASFPSLRWPSWQVGKGDKGRGLWGPQLCAPCPLPGQEHGVGAGQCQPSTCRDPRVPTMPVGPAQEGLRRLPERPRQGAGGAPRNQEDCSGAPGALGRLTESRLSGLVCSPSHVQVGPYPRVHPGQSERLCSGHLSSQDQHTS